MNAGGIKIDIPAAASLFDGKDFANEKDLCSFIEINMAEFCLECLGVELASYEREYPIQIPERQRRVKGIRRIDFFIRTKCGKTIGVECKHPHYPHSELSAAIGQVLSYMSIFNQFNKPLDRTVLVSSKVDYIIPQVIKDFKLPIDFVCINKRQSVVMDRDLLFAN